VGTILLIILILLLLGAFGGADRFGWGYAPGGLLMLVLVIVLILVPAGACLMLGMSRGDWREFNDFVIDEIVVIFCVSVAITLIALEWFFTDWEKPSPDSNEDYRER
jgi:hypothetical protein